MPREMKYDPDKHHRRSIRMNGYDYRQAGAYFVTICVQDRVCLFGDIVGNEMRLNDVGRLVQSTWDDLPHRFTAVDLDMTIVMPNHFHGIITVGALLAAPLSDMSGSVNAGAGANAGAVANAGAASSAPTLGNIMRAFKSISAINVNRFLERSGHPLWQRNYYEHIIRNEESLNRIRQYIIDNPARWATDHENPDAMNGELEDAWIA